jgi:hypothetical protein
MPVGVRPIPRGDGSDPRAGGKFPRFVYAQGAEARTAAGVNTRLALIFRCLIFQLAMITQRIPDDSPRTTIIVVADLGHMRAYRLSHDGQKQMPQLEPLTDRYSDVAHHLSDDMVVQPGKFTRGSAGTGGGSDGQEHNLSLERRHRALKQLAKNIATLLKREKAEAWYLAADDQINKPLLDEMPAAARAQMRKNICANLTGLKPAAVAKRFAEMPRKGTESSPGAPPARLRNKPLRMPATKTGSRKAISILKTRTR